LSFLFLDAQSTWPAMKLQLTQAVAKFDPSINYLVPENELDFVNFLSWLLLSGVHVVIDEFQLLTKLNGFYDFLRSAIDQYSKLWKGSLIVLGSHVTEIDRIITNQQSPLYGRGFTRIFLKPWSFSQIYMLLQSYGLDSLTILELYTCFDGIVAQYEQAYEKQFNMDSAVHIVMEMMAQDMNYSSQLSSKHSAALRTISENDGEDSSRIYDLIGNQSSLTRHAFKPVLDDLIRFGFCKLQNPWLQVRGNNEIVKLIDCPIRTFKAKDFKGLQGPIFEEICRELVEEKECLGSAKIIDNYWNEHCTEIDLVAEDENAQVIYWGSCKRNGMRHVPFNSLCHVISFFNNRDYSEHKWYSWKHRFVFFSPSFTEEMRNGLIKSSVEMNNWLEKSNINEITLKCQSLLSNYCENKHLKKEKKTNTKKEAIPEALFTPNNMPEKLSIRVVDCLVFNLAQLATLESKKLMNSELTFSAPREKKKKKV